MQTEVKSSRDYGLPSFRQRLHRFTAPLRFHRLNWWVLFTAFALLTGLSALAYYELSMTSGPDEISSLACKVKESDCLVGEALYLSIATETTVGYGDLSPKHSARVVAGVQALLGLMLAGAFLAKIASLPTRATRQLIEKCNGYWIEFSETRRHTMISFVTIAYNDSLVHYSGDNFDSKGDPLKRFSGHIEPINFTQGSKVAFWYTNESDLEDFYEGTTTLRFVEENVVAQRFTRFFGSAVDTRRGTIKMCGYRVLKADESRFLSRDRAERKTLALEYLERYEADLAPQVQEVLRERSKRIVCLDLPFGDDGAQMKEWT